MDFEAEVEAALESLPAEIRSALENVAVVIEDEHPEEPDLLGSYDGLGPGRDHSGALPDRIVIYRRPLVEAFPDPQRLRREIRVTVLHELGHFFGLDEDRISDLGYG